MIWFGLVDLVFNESSFTLISWKAADKKIFPAKLERVKHCRGFDKMYF